MMTVFSFGITRGILTHGPINRTKDIGLGRRSAAGSCVILDRPVRTTKRKEMGTELIWHPGSVVAQSVSLEGSWEYCSASAARSPSPRSAACLCFYFPTSSRMSLSMLGWGFTSASQTVRTFSGIGPDEFEHESVDGSVRWTLWMATDLVHHLRNNMSGSVRWER